MFESEHLLTHVMNSDKVTALSLIKFYLNAQNSLFELERLVTDIKANHSFVLENIKY